MDATADSAGDAVRDLGNATEDAARQATGTWTWNRREEYRQEARERLAGLDRQLADVRKNVNHDASEAFTKGVAAARETRRDVGANIDRLGQATESNWTEVRDEFRASIDSSPVSSRRSSRTRSRWEAPGRSKLLPRGTRR